MTNVPAPPTTSLNEKQLIDQWNTVRWHLIASQFAPTFLLIVTVGLLAAGLGAAPLTSRIAALGILLAGGILGALVQISAAGEADAVIEDLRQIVSPSALSRRIIQGARFTSVVRYVCPTIFVLVFITLFFALLVVGR